MPDDVSVELGVVADPIYLRISEYPSSSCVVSLLPLRSLSGCLGATVRAPCFRWIPLISSPHPTKFAVWVGWAWNQISKKYARSNGGFPWQYQAQNDPESIGNDVAQGVKNVIHSALVLLLFLEGSWIQRSFVGHACEPLEHHGERTERVGDRSVRPRMPRVPAVLAPVNFLGSSQRICLCLGEAAR